MTVPALWTIAVFAVGCGLGVWVAWAYFEAREAVQIDRGAWTLRSAVGGAIKGGSWLGCRRSALAASNIPCPECSGECNCMADVKCGDCGLLICMACSLDGGHDCSVAFVPSAIPGMPNFNERALWRAIRFGTWL